jgi:hypothetical protein
LKDGDGVSHFLLWWFSLISKCNCVDTIAPGTFISRPIINLPLFSFKKKEKEKEKEGGGRSGGSPIHKI